MSRSPEDQIRELEECAAMFRGEAAASARAAQELEEALRLEAQARRKLEELVARQTEQLRRLKDERDHAVATAAVEFEEERLRIMDAAEEVRREGIEALEQARELASKTPRSSGAASR